MEKLLQVRDLTKIYSKKGREDFAAVDCISFDLYRNECLGIIGESGSGKSTTAHMIARLIDATAGTITLDGQDITTLKNRERRNIYRKMQMIFQTPIESFNPKYTLGHGIGESLRNNGYTRHQAGQEVLKLLKSCELSADFADKYPHEVSGGQCQRAAIARALAIAPRLLICDEATSALDVTIQKDIMELLKELLGSPDRDLSILFICHDIALVQQFCSRVLVMYKGRIVEEGDPGEIIKNPKDPYTKKLIESVL